MFYGFHSKKRIFFKVLFLMKLVLLSTLVSLTINAAEVPIPPITNTLPAQTGTSLITKEWLLAQPLGWGTAPCINWLDNKQFIYSLPPKEDGKENTVELYNLDTKTHALIAHGVQPKPSSDGHYIALVRGLKNQKQLWLFNTIDGNLKQITSIEDGLGFYDFIWSPDSKYILLARQPYTKSWENKLRPESKLEMLDIETGQSELLASIDAAINYLSWLPGSDEIVFVKTRYGKFYNEEEDKAWVQSLNTKNKSIKTLTQFDGLQQFLKPTPAPDGKSIAILYDADNPIYSFMPSIGLLSSEKSKGQYSLTRLTYDLKLDLPQWDPNGKSVYGLRYYGAYQQLYKINAKTGKALQLTNAPLHIITYALSRDGKQIAWIGEDAHGKKIVRMGLHDGSSIRDIDIRSNVPEKMTLSEVREVEWKTTYYPINMRGLLVLPVNYQQGTKYPLIVDIHGGDAGASIELAGGLLVSSPLEWQLWAAKGYAVFIPEFRSSAAFGSLAITRDLMQEHNRLGADLQDIEAGVDAFIAEGIVDGEQLAVIAHSAGGVRANWLTVSTHRYKAVVSKEGWADEWTPALNQPPSKRQYVMAGGSPWEVPENYLKNSALHHAVGTDTPTLFLMANPEQGGVDPYQTVFQLYTFMKNEKVDTQYKYYPNEGHVFVNYENRKDVLERSMKWIEDHLSNKKIKPET